MQIDYKTNAIDLIKKATVLVKQISIEKHYPYLVIPLLLIIALLYYSITRAAEEAFIKDFNYLADIIEEYPEELEIYFYADEFLKFSKRNLLITERGVKVTYNTNNQYRRGIDKIHSVESYVNANRLEYLKKLAFLQKNNCNKTQYIIDYDSVIEGVISEDIITTVKFINLETYKLKNIK